jgi:hypothetical protein
MPVSRRLVENELFDRRVIRPGGPREIRAHGVERGHSRRATIPQPENDRLHGLKSHRTGLGRDARAVLPAGTGFHVLGGSEGEHVRGVHVPDCLPARENSGWHGAFEKLA